MHCSGEIRVFVDGIEVRRPWNNLPVNVPVFGFVGLDKPRDKRKLQTWLVVLIY